MFKRIGKKVTLSQEIEEKIEEVIVQKKLVAGEKLPTEKELCEMFGVSRTALREALHMLSARGLISVRKGSGIYVNDYTSQYVTRTMNLYLNLNFDKKIIMDVIQVRKLLEPEIARLAALHRTDKHLEALRKNIEQFKKCDNDDVERESNLDLRFHTTIAEACGNSLIPLIVDPIFKQMPKIRTLVYAKIDQARSSALDYHIKIFNKIKEQDSEAARNAMREHLVIAEQHSKEIAETL